MENNRWIINKLGLINFWYYDEEEFTLSDGKLLLRGSNGSGKSVTMQSFIPLLLDGNKSPERLDPFGSKARKLENYLLGEEDSGKDESMGYLYIEFKKRETENYLTIGMGFKAVRGKSLKSWGFSITDGRRIGKDFLLYKNIGEKLPLTMKELENKIGSGGQVQEGQRDYMKMINDLLFGFADIEEYEELVKLMVQLRTPKLSKDFKPTVIYEIMENSLQPLSEDDLRPMSEAIENMDNIKSRLEELIESRKAAEKIRNAFDKYNNFTITNKSNSYIKSTNELAELEKNKASLIIEKERAEKAYKDSEDEFEHLSTELDVNEEKKRQLDSHDSVKIKETISDLEGKIKSYNKDKSEKEEQLEKKRQFEAQISNKIKIAKDEKYSVTKEVNQILDEMSDDAEEFSFDEHEFLKDELIKSIHKEYSFSFVKDKLEKYMISIEKAIKALEEEKRKNADHDLALQELEQSKAIRDENSRLLDQARMLLEEIKQEYIEKIYGWRKDNKEFILSEDVIINVAREVKNFDDTKGFDSILEYIRNDYNKYQDKINSTLYGLKGEKEKLEKEANNKEKEIEQWKSKKDPEPIREEKVVLSRTELKSLGIPFIPFYKAIDFKENVSEEIRGRIEEALLDMGLLDALIIPEKYRKNLSKEIVGADKYIIPSPNYLAYDLSEFLKSEKIDAYGISSSDVDVAIKSVLIDPANNETYINENGDYCIGILKGNVSGNYQSKFIGSAARKRYREQQINMLINELSEIKADVSDYNLQIQGVEVRLSNLKTEYQSIPSYRDILTANREVNLAKDKYETSSKNVTEKAELEEKLYKELKKIKEMVHELTFRLPLKGGLDVYKEGLDAGKDYKDKLYELDKFHLMLLRTVEEIKGLLDQQGSVLEDIDNIQYDINSIERELDKSKSIYNNLTEQLKISDYETIKKELDECIRALKEIPKKQIEVARRSEHEKNNINSNSQKLIDIEEKIKNGRNLKVIYESSFIEEYGLGYSVTYEQETDYLKIAKKIIKENLVQDKVIKDNEDYVNSLYQRYQENSQYLREYSVKIEYLFSENNGNESNIYALALSKRKRQNVVAKVRGKEVSFYKLMDFIIEGIEENENLLRESDRQLFEDILVKNISKKIRAKIYHSELWVKKMNDLMEGMNTSSGLSFSLKWSNKKAETEEQLDTKELVDLLKQDGNLMREEDLNKLSEHFRSKIALARRSFEDKGQTQTFHTIMKEILDYRKWFEFKLSFIKIGQNKKELTNNAFFQFSGGEKAMAMYVPLFSAVYARYEGGRNDSPRIISLDEAFAGVDEKNIRDMFKLLGELGLDYVINSQILWGDYDTVQALSICELIRPDNADFVTVIRYKWNGKVKELVV